MVTPFGRELPIDLIATKHDGTVAIFTDGDRILCAPDEIVEILA